VPSAFDDESFIMKDLRTLKPFKFTAGRSLQNVKTMPWSVKDQLDFAKFTKWINEKKCVYDIEHGK
jgi:hypothetical protein